MLPIAISMVARSHRMRAWDTPLPEDTSEDRPHIAFTPYLRQLTERVIDGLEDPLDRARAIYDYLTQHIDYRYQPPYLLLESIADELCTLAPRRLRRYGAHVYHHVPHCGRSCPLAERPVCCSRFGGAARLG